MYIVPQLRGDEKAYYLRKSQTDDPLLSLEEVLQKHEDMLDEWVSNNQPEGGKVPESNIFREIGSAETIAARPRMTDLLRLVESPKIKAIMVTEPSRLSRGDLEDIGYLVKVLRYTKTLVITLGYTYDLTDERDRDLFERELMRGNSYLEYSKKIRLNGRLAAVKAGAFIGQTAPYGYQKDIILVGKRKMHTLKPDPDEAPVVRRIFEMYASGMGWQRIADQLNKEHISAPRGDKWTKLSLPGMLTNVHYIGKVKWFARKTVCTIEEGQVKVSRPRSQDFLTFDGLHDAIIDLELWEKVQAILGSHPRNNKASNLSNPLAGLLWCSCGRAMVGRPYNGKDGKPKAAPRFHCPEQRNCGCASAKMQDVLDEVVKVLSKTLDDFEVRMKDTPDDTAERHRKMIARMEKRLEELKKLEVKQWSEKMKNNMPEHVFKELNEPTVKEIEELEIAIHEAKEESPTVIDMSDKIITLKSTITALQDENAPVREKNMLLKACIERIEYRRERYTAVGTPSGMKETPIYLDFTLKF